MVCSNLFQFFQTFPHVWVRGFSTMSDVSHSTSENISGRMWCIPSKVLMSWKFKKWKTLYLSLYTANYNVFQNKILEVPLTELSDLFLIFKFSWQRNFSFSKISFLQCQTLISHHCLYNPTWIIKSALKELYTLMRLPAFRRLYDLKLPVF